MAPFYQIITTDTLIVFILLTCYFYLTQILEIIGPSAVLKHWKSNITFILLEGVWTFPPLISKCAPAYQHHIRLVCIEPQPVGS